MYADQTVNWYMPLVTRVCNQIGEHSHGSEEHSSEEDHSHEDDSDEDDSDEDDGDDHDGDEHILAFYVPDDEYSPQPTNPLMEFYTSPPATFFVR